MEVGGTILDTPLAPAQIHDGPTDRWLNIETFENTAPLLKITVRDNGPGIPTEVLPKIFDAYFTTKSARNGTGLGLSIVQRLVRNAKGLLHVHTESGKGTAFTIYLPAHRKS